MAPRMLIKLKIGKRCLQIAGVPAEKPESRGAVFPRCDNAPGADAGHIGGADPGVIISGREQSGAERI